MSDSFVTNISPLTTNKGPDIMASGSAGQA